MKISRKEEKNTTELECLENFQSQGFKLSP